MKLVLLHSPLVSAATWERLAPLLRARGHAVEAPDLQPLLMGGAPYYSCIAETIRSEDAIVVAHSGAGALVPLAEAARGAIFLDAILPHPGRSWFENAPPALAAHLIGLAKEGMLPPWHRWWSQDAVARMLGDVDAATRFAAMLKPLPLGYLTEKAPERTFAAPAAYLQLSAGYDGEAADAARRGWPVSRLALNHLAMLTHPELIADALEGLLAKF
ncbi:MAG: alpha/beta hydrolase [Proteobacteria bacterium]|nr:alpha/beta hydrolase [Pseudomonadota bacterium]